MVWDRRDVGVLDLAVLPRAGMAKPPCLENWGDLINHSSLASVLPRSSSPRARYWNQDMKEDYGPPPASLQSSLTTDPDLCTELGFVPGTLVQTPTGRIARVVGAVQPDPRDYPNKWRLWGEYIDAAGPSSGSRGSGVTSRQQRAPPGTPCSPRSPRAAAIRSLSNTNTPRSPRSNLSSPRLPQAKGAAGSKPAERRPETARLLSGNAIDRTRESHREPLPPASDAASHEQSRLKEDEGAPREAEGTAEPPVLSSTGFLFPARAVEVRQWRSFEVSSPRYSYGIDSTVYLEQYKPADVVRVEPEFVNFSEADEFRKGTLWWTPLGALVETSGSHVVPKPDDPYDFLNAKSNPFSWLHHCQTASDAPNNTESNRMRVDVKAAVQEQRKCKAAAHRPSYPLERSLMESVWPKDPATAKPFGYSEATSIDAMRLNLLRQRRKNPDRYIQRFKSEDAPPWAPATTMMRAELYERNNGIHHYRGNRMSSSPAAVATRCGYGPHEPAVPRHVTPSSEPPSAVAQMLEKRRPRTWHPLDSRTGLAHTQGWHKRLTEPPPRERSPMR